MASSTALKDRFRGCMLGGVVGDCLGARFEGLYWGSTVPEDQVASIVSDMTAPPGESGRRKKVQKYTDDTSMAFTLARSLLDNNGFREKYMAKSFANDYTREPDRGYGSGVVTVFHKLRESNRDVFAPAMEQFDGSGSYGNGAGMRAAPVALFSNSQAELEQVALQQAMLTHAHPEGALGAIVQATAVRFALLADRSAPIDVTACLQQLTQVVKRFPGQLSEDNAELGPLVSFLDSHVACIATVETYLTKLESLAALLDNDDTTQRDVMRDLGNGIEAREAVPAAIFTALRSLKKHGSLRGDGDAQTDGTAMTTKMAVDDTAVATKIAVDDTAQAGDTPTAPQADFNAMTETVVYAISLGGDTDTIACMAGGIVGAYVGGDSIDSSWKPVCEGYATAVSLAEKFHARYEKSSSAMSGCTAL